MKNAMQSPIFHRYDTLAPIYDRRWKRYLDQTLTPATCVIKDSRPLQILDIACGTGEMIQRLLVAAPKAKIVGVDGSKAMLGIASQKFQKEPRVSFQQALAESLPFPDHIFDWVISCNSFHCFDQLDQVFSEVTRVLGQEGHLLVVDWCRNAWHCRLMNRWLTLFDETHHWMYTMEELSQMAVAHHLVVEKINRFRIDWPVGFRFLEMMLFVGFLPKKEDDQ